ncbi:MAG: hypothetical protein HC890_12850 [Chloroflexaceae bacterium]|nr:hypothetical protein [Chloroflexaceae bacterium]
MICNQQQRANPFSRYLKKGIWLLGLPIWIFAIADRSLAALADGYFSGLDVVQILTATFFCFCWLLLKPR